MCRKDCQTAWRSGSAATDAIGAHHFNDSLYELHCLPEIATSAYGLLAMTNLKAIAVDDVTLQLVSLQGAH